ncbi:DUF397 domain-containing protein [Streptomyces silvensis]|uniref:DUF397 domain-containing protein n=1 Tax=Streptomyces silvensis TaxID=1765722 RepID=A0A0W7WY54_9ACTN|nr:DUF397 domain-containing protein [Streptomyces silvensis]KUF15508.1 hypothetical protein AT728_25990 [Streptomyces silvensis]
MQSNRERQLHLAPTVWRKSSYSGADSGQCVEVGSAHRQVALVPVRDSKNPHGPAVLVGAPAWQAFVTHLAG